MAATGAGLLAETRGLLDRAVEVYRGTPAGQELQDVLERLDEPLRVAIAGKVKAGKSTLLNALVGEELAPTDEGECTRIVTWYRDGVTYRVTLENHQGESRQVPFVRDEGAIQVDLGGTNPEEVERLLVDWPSSSLRELTLIDTPGIGSLSTDVSARTTVFLTPDEDKVTPADAVLYLMKHLHTTDLRFLETFHDEEVSQANPVNAIAVLSRADEIGAGRIDSLESAERIALRYRSDEKVQKLAQTVVPVAGLIAETGETLREAEFKALSELASVDPQEVEGLLLSVGRFINADTTSGLTSLEREALLDRLGLFGVRLAVQLIRDGAVANAGDLSEELVRRSGLIELRRVLLSQFADRRNVLKARAALLAVEAAARQVPTAQSGDLAADVERITAGAHEFDELRLLNALRTGALSVKEGDRQEIERLLGTSGTAATARLGLTAEAQPGEIGQAAQDAMGRWQRKAESPMSSKELAEASRVIVRTCEGILTELA